MLAFRGAVIRGLKERFGVRAIAQAPPQFRFRVTWHGGECHQTGQGEGANPCYCESWILNRWRWRGVEVFSGQIISRTVKGAGGLAAFQRACQRASHPRGMPAAWEKRSRTWKRARRRYRSQTISWTASTWVKEGSEDFVVGTPAGCVVHRTVKRRPREDAADGLFQQHPWNTQETGAR